MLHKANNYRRSHIHQVDYIRAFASLAVTQFHLGGKILPFLNLGWLGVQMFFLLSGFIICWSMPGNYTLKNSGTFIARRITRIEIPYFVSIILIIVLNYVLVSNYKPDWLNVLCHIAYINSFIDKSYLSPVYWTLGIEFQFYLLIAFAFPLFNSKHGKYILVIFAVLAFFLPRSGNLITSSSPLFLMGIATYLFKTEKLSSAWFAGLLSLFIIMAFISIGLLPTCAGLIALAMLFLPLRHHPIVSFLSKISFSLYLTHDFIGSRVVLYLEKALPKTFFFKGIDFMAGLVISLLFAYLFYLAIEKPAITLSKRFHYKQTL